jgi:hypothetical protein
MPEYRSHTSLGERRWFHAGPPAERTIVSAVVTELVLALEPVARDPFMDGADDLPRLRSADPSHLPRSRPVAGVR